MKVLRQILFIAMMTVCAAFAAHAQERDKRTPPKESKPPVVVVKEKEKPREDRPRNDDNNSNRNKKPQGDLSSAFQSIGISLN